MGPLRMGPLRMGPLRMGPLRMGLVRQTPRWIQRLMLLGLLMMRSLWRVDDLRSRKEFPGRVEYKSLGESGYCYFAGPAHAFAGLAHAFAVLAHAFAWLALAFAGLVRVRFLLVVIERIRYFCTFLR